MGGRKKTFLEQTWVQWTAIVGFIGVGYTGGTYNANIDCKLEKVKLQEETNLKLQQASNECRDLRNAEFKKVSDDIKGAIKELGKRANAKQ